MPTSAVANAGASLTPSPTIATLRPPSWNRLTAAALSAGSTCAATSSMPRRRATESATAWLSPVIIATLTPNPMQLLDRLVRLGRISSSTATAPATRPSTTTCRTVRPCASHSPAIGSGSRPRSARRRGPPTSTMRPSTVARRRGLPWPRTRRRPTPATREPERRRRSPAQADVRNRPRRLPPDATTPRPLHRRERARPWSACRSCRR